MSTNEQVTPSVKPNPLPTYLVVTYDMGLAVDEADEADDVESALCVDCITLLLLLLGTDVWIPLPPCEPELGECGPDEMVGLFFHGWKPLPTAASASGGGDLLESLLHWAASMASGVPRRPGWSWKD